MKSMPKWFLIPPAVAALLILGTLSMQGGPAASNEPPGTPKTTTAETGETTGRGRREATPLPRTPDLTQMVSAMAAVLLLGVGGVMLLRHLRGPARAKAGASLMSLRQTLRLSQRQAVHAIEFDDRILLVGESERGLLLLESSRAPERLSDEAEVIARAHVPAARATDDDDDGAVPKNLVIPRPDQPVAARRPTPPAIKPTAGAANPGLGDFRALLQKAGRA